MYLCQNKEYEVDPLLFSKYLAKETNLLKEWFDKKYFTSQGLHAGAEIEFLMLNKNYRLTPHNISFIEKLNNPLIGPESGTSQLEINTSALPICDNFLSTLHHNILTLWEQCCALAQKENYHLLLIGSMPQAAKKFSQLSCITPQNDFYLMNDYTTQYRKGFPLVINLEGPQEHLRIKLESLALEGLICSFQLHLAVNQEQASAYYNAIQSLSAPLLALSSNAPFFYGANTWSESRIAIFEQLYHFPLPTKNTVFFEPHYLEQSLFDLFQNNTQDYPYLVPIVENKPEEYMSHVRRQNSCIFRWNRPILDFNEQNRPYLRIEHRSLSSGTTIIDMVANAAFFYGIVYYFANYSLRPVKNMQETVLNFYRAAQYGLNAQFQWNGAWIKACELLKELVPLAAKGLEQLGVNHGDINFYLELIKKRVANKQNGSLWQQAYIHKYGKNFPNMLEHYLKNQYSELPVSDWRL